MKSSSFSIPEKLLAFSCGFALLVISFEFVIGTRQSHAQTPASPAAKATISATPALSPTPPPIPEQGIDFTVSPVSINLNQEPGSSEIYPLKIRNNGAEAEAIVISLKRLVGRPDGSFTFADYDPNDPILSWVSFDQDQFLLAPDTWHQVDMTFTPDTEAQLGYYFAILFNRQRDIEAQTGSAQLVGAPAIIALADIASDQARPELAIIDFSTSKTWYDFLPVEFNVTFQNTGNIHLRPFGNIFIDQGSQQDIGVLNMQDIGSVLPGQSRTFTATWDDGFPLRLTNPINPEESFLEWNLDNAGSFRLGKFTATALAAYDDGQRDVPMEATTDFWILPWQFIAIAAVVGLVTLIGVVAILSLLIKPFRRNK